MWHTIYMNEWYQTLLRPEWAPPAWVFGPVWTFLYAVIAVSFGYVFYQVWRGRWPWWVALPFGLNLLCNAAFTPLQFGWQINWLALIDVVLVVVTLIWAMAIVWPRARWVVWVNVPYLVWGSFATVLQASITWLNW